MMKTRIVRACSTPKKKNVNLYPKVGVDNAKLKTKKEEEKDEFKDFEIPTGTKAVTRSTKREQVIKVPAVKRSTRRQSMEMPVKVSEKERPGLSFMKFFKKPSVEVSLPKEIKLTETHFSEEEAPLDTKPNKTAKTINSKSLRNVENIKSPVKKIGRPRKVIESPVKEVAVQVVDTPIKTPRATRASRTAKAEESVEVPKSKMKAGVLKVSKEMLAKPVTKVVAPVRPRMSLRSKTPVVSAINSPIKQRTPKVTKAKKLSVKNTPKKQVKKAKVYVPTEEQQEEADEFEIEISEEEEEEEVLELSDFEEDQKTKKRGKKLATKARGKGKTTSTVNNRNGKKKKSDSRWDRIKDVLKAGGTIEALPGRIDEFEWIKRTVTGLLESSLGGCLYISGVPGTGKTATTHRTLDALSLAALKAECCDFDFVEINGMRLSDPGQAYSILAKTIFRERKGMSNASALQKLEAHFKAQQKSKTPGRPCVVLLDELDLLLRKKQSILYHFFEWPNWSNSQLIVITIANTMDLPERFLSNRISSRLGLTRYNFKPYDHAALANIIEHQLKDHVKYLGKDAIQLCARKVSAVSGDARRAVNLAKRAVDYFRSTSQEELMSRMTGRVVEKVAEGSEMTAVNLRLMDLILKDALLANPVEVIGQLAKHQRVLLLSIVLARKRLEEELVVKGGTKIIGSNASRAQALTVNRLLDQHFQLCRTHQYHPLPSLQELHVLLESLEALRLIRCVKFREAGPEGIVQLLVHEEDVRKGLGDDSALKKYIRE